MSQPSFIKVSLNIAYLRLILNLTGANVLIAIHILKMGYGMFILRLLEKTDHVIT